MKHLLTVLALFAGLAAMPAKAAGPITLHIDAEGPGVLETVDCVNGAPVSCALFTPGKYSWSGNITIPDFGASTEFTGSYYPLTANFFSGTLTRDTGNSILGSSFTYHEDKGKGCTGSPCLSWYQLDFTAATFRVTQTSPTPVPEPTMWAMLIVGFGLVGFALRRQRELVVA